MRSMAPVTVTVRLSGPLAQSLGARRSLGMGEGATVYDLLEAIAREAGIEPRDAGTLAVVAGGSFLARSQLLADGDELDVLVPVAGG
jgi:molybdopterin converting factor small subunit